MRPRSVRRYAAVLVALALALPLSGAPNTFGGQASVLVTAANITTLLSLSPARSARQLSVRIDPASANTIYCGPSTVTNVPANARVVIAVASTPAYTWQPGDSRISTDDIYCVATTGTTVAFVDGVE